MPDATVDTTALPALQPLAAPLAELTKEEMRERQRLHVKRTYYRKLNTLQTLRDEQAALEKEYASLVKRKKEAESGIQVVATTNSVLNSPDLTSADVFFDDFENANTFNVGANTNITNVGAFTNTNGTLVGNTATGLQSLQELYTEISVIKEQLRHQNEAMRHAIIEHARFAQKMKSWLELDEPPSSSGDELQDPLAPKATLTPQLTAPINVDVCHGIVQSTFEDMQRFRRSHAFLTTGVSVFGWRDKRLRQGDRVKFSLKKLFHGITPFELSLRGWAVLASSKQLPTLYTATMNVKIVPIQRVDDNNEIMFRVMTSPDGRCLVKTLFLVSRFEIPNGGFAILVHSLDKSCLAPYTNPPGVMELWIDYYTWITFEPYGVNGEHCKLDFGGEVQSNPVVGSDMWMLEVLLIALRWESKVLGPIFSIC